MSGEGVLIELIGTLGMLTSVALTALVNRRVGRVERDTRSSRAQLENDHQMDPLATANLREDMDNKHRETLTELRTTRGDLHDLREDIRLLRAAGRSTDLRLDNHLKGKGHDR